MRLLDLFFILFFSLGYAQEKAIKLCEHIFLLEGELSLNGNEKVLVCGSHKGGVGWESIPLTQAEWHLRAILQNVGYLQPRFQKDKGRLFVWAGPQRIIKELVVEGAEGVLRPLKKRKVVGETLTPEKLNEVEAWANLSVRSQGYACPELRVEAHLWDDTVWVRTKLGEQKVIGGFNADHLEGLSLIALDRYRPFAKGEVYDIRKTQLMTSRLVSDGLFQSAFFETRCHENQVQLDLKTNMGRPRILRFGIGASTEELPFADIDFRNTRLDNKASSATLNLHLSPRLLRFMVDSKLFWFSEWPTIFFAPRFRLTREIEAEYQTDSGRLGADLGRNWDAWNIRIVGRSGPSLNYVKTTRGFGPADFRYPSLDASLALMNHDYEATIWQQYQGWSAHLNFRGQSQGLGSLVNVYRYEGDFKYLWNIGQFAPPLFVLGTRLEGISVDATDVNDQSTPSLVPIEDRIFVGGDQDLRGFPRKSINNRGLGYLTFLYLGFELRLIEVLPYRLQPFLLMDAALLGTRRYTLEQPVFGSDGIGLRWLSPIGTIRGSLAKGRISAPKESTPDYPRDWVFFFSFGQEF